MATPATAKRRPSFVTKCGPYVVRSCADGSLEVTPSWPQFPPYNDEDGGGPGLFSRVHLAAELQAWLNAPYEVPA